MLAFQGWTNPRSFQATVNIPVGTQGPQGLPGIPSITGPKGDTGAASPAGPRGRRLAPAWTPSKAVAAASSRLSNALDNLLAGPGPVLWGGQHSPFSIIASRRVAAACAVRFPAVRTVLMRTVVPLLVRHTSPSRQGRGAQRLIGSACRSHGGVRAGLIPRSTAYTRSSATDRASAERDPAMDRRRSPSRPAGGAAS
jgi:hypothetical protein